jgi:hypothetical protein
MKTLTVLAFVLLVSPVFAKENWESQITMQKINRIQALYDEGVKLHQKGSTNHGCYVVRQAVRESWMLQSDNKMTYNQLKPLYANLCKRDY